MRRCVDIHEWDFATMSTPQKIQEKWRETDVDSGVNFCDAGWTFDFGRNVTMKCPRTETDFHGDRESEDFVNYILKGMIESHLIALMISIVLTLRLLDVADGMLELYVYCNFEQCGSELFINGEMWSMKRGEYLDLLANYLTQPHVFNGMLFKMIHEEPWVRHVTWIFVRGSWW